MQLYVFIIFRLLRLRNPWGSFVWNGEWGWNWFGWINNPELKKRLGADSSFPGTFWISFENFVKYFDSVDVAQIRENWTSKRYLIDIGWVEGKCK